MRSQVKISHECDIELHEIGLQEGEGRETGAAGSEFGDRHAKPRPAQIRDTRLDRLDPP